VALWLVAPSEVVRAVENPAVSGGQKAALCLFNALLVKARVSGPQVSQGAIFFTNLPSQPLKCLLFSLAVEKR
jgi:hypothetical protein